MNRVRERESMIKRGREKERQKRLRRKAGKQEHTTRDIETDR